VKQDTRDLHALAAASAESGDFDSAIKWQETAIELQEHERNKEAARRVLGLYQDRKPYRETRPLDAGSSSTLRPMLVVLALVAVCVALWAAKVAVQDILGSASGKGGAPSGPA
jgi:ferric-dicitrate binding protein FerR (iron transport regulator)